MPKINVYLPDDLAAAVRDAKLPVSAICQAALERAVREVNALHSADGLPAIVADAMAEADAATQAGGRLFQRFTPRARQSIVLARQVAHDIPHMYIGTEHLLLGVLEVEGNLALKVFEAMDVDVADLRAELEGSMGPATEPGPDRIPFTPLAKMALANAKREALGFAHNYIGCEHILLGLVATDGGLASQVLTRMGLDLRSTRKTVTTLLSGFMQARDTLSPPETSVPAPSTEMLGEILRRLDALEQRLAS